MRIIHLLRKPFSGSVASNVLEHGCGALNIDATRVAFKGEQSPSVARRDSAARTGRAGRVTSAQRAGEGRFAAGQDVKDALANYVTPNAGEFKGRWPANVILEHTEECRIVGVRERPAHTSTERGWHTSYVGGEKSKVIETQTLGDADGIDRSDLWECAPDCPAADLDEATAELLPQGGPKRKDTADSAWFGGGHPEGFYGDSGGASRFFFQFKRSDG